MIHKYRLNDYNVVLDVNSGGVHLVDELTYDLLDNVSPPFSDNCPNDIIEKLSKYYGVNEIESCYKEIVELTKQGILFSSDDYEKFAEYAVASPVKAVCLLVSQDCNLRCEYCFASTGDYGIGRRLMSLETAKKAIDFVAMQSKDRQNIEVDFFGGEPTLNFDVVKETVLYARSLEKKLNKNFRFTLTTNGVLFNDDMIEFANKEMSNVVLSLDGRKEVHDKMRKHVDGSGSYDQIMKNFKKCVEGRGDKEYYVRGTYTKHNLDFSNDVMHIYNEGFDQVSVEPVMAPAEMDYAITESDLPQVYKEYENLALKLLDIEKKGEFCNFYHFMIDLDQGPCAIKRLRGCGAGNEYVAVNPDGDIYPCHQFVGIDKFNMGNVFKDNFVQKIKDDFAKIHIYSKPECKKCWAKFYCSGGCNANNYIYNGDVLDSHRMSCQIEKKRIECAILMKIIRFQNEGK